METFQLLLTFVAVAIVTSAASPTGAAICRELLNSNANVLGVDNVPAHKTTSFSKGSHFQFLRCEGNSVLDGPELVEYAKKVYMRDNIDFLIDVLGETSVGSGFLEPVIEIMQDQGGGMVLGVVPPELTDLAKEKKVVCLFFLNSTLNHSPRLLGQSFLERLLNANLR